MLQAKSTEWRESASVLGCYIRQKNPFQIVDLLLIKMSSYLNQGLFLRKMFFYNDGRFILPTFVIKNTK